MRQSHANIFRTRLRQADDVYGKLSRLAASCRDTAEMLRVRDKPEPPIVDELHLVAAHFDWAADMLHVAIKSAYQRSKVREPS